MNARYTAEDIAALREQGDLKRFLEGLADVATPSRTAAAPSHRPTATAGRQPGAWPAGTRPPDPGPAIARAEVDRAVAEYRAWQTAGRPIVNASCQCGCTPGSHHTPTAA